MGQKPEADLRFAKFGTVSFTATTKVNDFIDHLEKGRVMGTRCRSCGKSFFPPRADCCLCLGSDLEWFEVKGSGTLLTYSLLSFAPAGFEDDVPYAIAVLDYGAFKIFGRIAADVPPEDLHPGLTMRTRVNRLPDGQLNYVFEKTS